MTGRKNRKNRKNYGARLLVGMLLIMTALLGNVNVAAAAAAASEQVDLNRMDGSVTLQLQYVDPVTSEVVKMTGGTVSVYKVSDFVLQEDGNYGFDISTGQFPEAKGMDNLKKRLSAENSTIASRLSRLASSKSGVEAQVSDGSVKVSHLSAGLFLMMQTKESPEKMVFDPFLFTMPYDGNFSVSLKGDIDVLAKPKVLILPTEQGDKGTTPSETVPTESAPPTEPTKPTTPTSPTPNTPPERGRIPQTGQLWWPVPILFIGGFFLATSGVIIRIRA